MPYYSFHKIQKLALLVAALAIVSAASCNRGGPSSPSSPLADGSLKTTAAATDDASLVKVTVGGEVTKPGIYSLNRQSNVAEAIVEAGGLTDRAVLENVNLKEMLRDNMKIVVPAVSPPPPRREVSSVVKVTNAVTINSVKPPPPSSPVAPVVPPVKRATMLRVVVKGAVANPGVYSLFPGELVASAIIASGGPAPNAKLSGINLDQPIQQGMTIIVPVNKAVVTVPRRMVSIPFATPKPAEMRPVPKSADSETGAAASVPQSPLDINGATVEQLQRLPGIGPSLASRIISYRKEVGAFRAPEQLMDVKGITPEKFGLIQSLVRTN